MSARLGMNKFRLTSLVRLSYLAPGVIRPFLAGRHPIALTPTRLLRLSKDLPHDCGGSTLSRPVDFPRDSKRNGLSKRTCTCNIASNATMAAHAIIGAGEQERSFSYCELCYGQQPAACAYWLYPDHWC
jgi:hypothetical protein